MSEIVLGIRLTADGKDLVGSVRLSTDEIKKMGEATKQASSKADQLNNQQKNLGQTLNVTSNSIGLYSAAWNQAANLIVRAAGAVKDYIKDAALLNARHETLGVVLGVVGRNAGYSRGEMDLYVESVRKSGITMIESRQNVIKMVQANLNLADASKLARVAQSAAVIAQTDSSDAFGRLVHGIQSGQTEILRTMGINVNFEESYKKLSKQIKVNVDQLTEQEKTQARANVTLEAGSVIAGIYAAAMDTASKQISSLVRLEKDLKTTAGEVFNEALVVGVIAYTSALKGAGDEAQKLLSDKKLKEWGEEVTDTFAFVADAATSAAATFRLVGVGIAEMAALGNLTPLEAWRGGWQAITDAADEQRAEIMRSTTMFRDALAERRKVVKEDAAQRALEGRYDEMDFGSRYANPAKIQRPGGKAGEGADLRDYVRQLKEQFEVTKQSSLEEKVLFDLREKHWKNATPALKARAVELARAIDSRKQEKDALEAYIKLEEFNIEKQKEVDDFMRARADKVGQAILAASKQIDQMEFEAALISKTNVERETDIFLRQAQINKIDAATIARGKEAIAAKHAAQETNASQVSMWRSVENAGHQAFLSIFDTSKSVLERIRDMLKTHLIDILYQLTARKWIFNIVASISGAGVAQSALGASGSGIGDMLGMASNASSLFGNSGSSIASFLGIGAAASTGTGLSLAGGGLGLSAAGGGLGLSTAGVNAAALGTGAAGTGIAAAIPYVGWALAAYGVLKSMGVFGGGGGGPASFTGIDVDANLSKDGFAGQLFGTSKNSKQSFRWPTFMPGNFQEAANAAVTAAFTQVSKLGQVMGLDTSGLSGVSANVSFRSASHDAAVITQDLVNNLGALTDQMALKLMPNIKDFAQANETLTQTLVRLAQARRQADVEDIFSQMNAALKLGDQMRNAALKLADQTRDLWLSDLSPLTNAQRLAQASGLYGQQLAAAQGGDLAALGNLSGTSRGYLQEARGYYASSQSYTDIFNQVQGQIGGLVSQVQNDATSLINTALTEQSIRFSEMGLTLTDISVNTKDLDKRIADAFNKAIDAWQAAHVAVTQASTQQIVAAVTDSAKETALVLESAASADLNMSPGAVYRRTHHSDSD